MASTDVNDTKCPHCGDTRQIEPDEKRRVWFCATCGRMWPMVEVKA